MTTQETQAIKALTKRVDAMQSDLSEIKETLASWTGGRKTLVWAIGFLLSVGIIISSIYEALKK